LIELKDGTTIEGTLRVVDDGWEITTLDGGKRTVAKTDVKSVRIDGHGQVSEDSARERLASLRRSVDAEKTIERVIERFEQFVKLNAGTSAATDAQSDLDAWRARLESGYVRHGREWVTHEEQLDRTRATVKAIESVQAMVASGQVNDAERLINEQLKAYPDQLSFLYLDGALKLDAGQFGPAKRRFESVLQAAPEHAPTLNNLALIAAEQKRPQQGVSLMERALRAAPNTRELIDNAAELLNLMANEKSRGSPIAQLERRFAQQEELMQKRMALEGLYRWGSDWVDASTLQTLKAEQVRIDGDLRAIESDRHAVLRMLDDAEQRLRINENLQKRIEADSVYRDAEGRLIRRPFPDAYWDTKRDIDLIRQQIDRDRAELTRLDDKAAQIRASQPRPPFNGRLKPIGVVGVPVELPPGIDAASLNAGTTTRSSL
jgi:tetratricopeptide (TPR) repeat protein